ncbi:MAG: exodeoxyribonuclease VII small subunit [Flavobacteriales bacterium]|jgi:exodeoxyribonuclease VII small subunit|nr:MAG: exodeoxyribonuclease VII small subunit [Flavobacteriales bacterium]
MSENTTPSYDQAFAELQQIMQALQNDEISVDELAAKVQRASELIILCNTRLRDTEKKVSEIIDELGL